MMSRARKRLDAKERRLKILDAATSAFALEGYDQTKMERIAAGAEITKPVLYDHFQSKLALYQAVLERLRDGLIAKGRSIMQEDGPPADKFRGAVDAFLRFVEDEPLAARVLLTVPSGDPAAAAAARMVQLGASEGIASLLAGVMATHSLWHVRAASAFLKEGLHAIALWWLDHPGPAREEITRIVLDIAWRGLRTQVGTSEAEGCRTQST